MDKVLEAKIKKMGYTSFKTKSEKPNFYELADGTILKVHTMIHAIVLDKGPNPQGASVNAQNVIASFVPKKLRGKPNEKVYNTKEINSNLDKEDMNFKIIAEHFNDYIVDNKWILSVKTSLSQVNRSKLRTNRGEPIYWISTSPVTKLKPKRR